LSLGQMSVFFRLSFIAPINLFLQDIFSYNVEQSRGDTHNMIVILMHYHGLTLQEAVDYVGSLCEETINAFIENKKRIPSWGKEIDDMVEKYVKGLQDWIVGFVFFLDDINTITDVHYFQFFALEFPDSPILRCWR